MKSMGLTELLQLSWKLLATVKGPQSQEWEELQTKWRQDYSKWIELPKEEK